MTLIYILMSTIIVSALSLIGVFFLSTNERKLQKIIFSLVSFATGALLGSAFLHLLPEAVESESGHGLESNIAFFIIIVGILTFFLLEKFLYWRHCHQFSGKESGICQVHTFTYLNLIGDGLHNFVDGIVIAVSYMVNIPLGIIASLAVCFHEIPQELGDFGILVYGGLSIKKALLFNFLSALTCIFGGLLTYLFGGQIASIKMPLLVFAAGGFLYIALVDLLPELRKTTGFLESLSQLTLILLGLGLMSGLRILFHQ